MKLRAFAFAALATLAPIAAHADVKPPAKTTAPADDKKPAPTGKEVSKADADRYVGFFNKLIDAIVANQTDCPKMASGISTLIEANQKLLADAKKAKAAGLELPQEYKDKIEGRVSKDMMPALQKKCIGDKDVQAAVAKMGS